MPNIRIRRFDSSEQGGWELDCILLPNDEMNGELVDYKGKRLIDFRRQFKEGLFAELDALLDEAVRAGETPREELRLVLGRLRDERKKYYFFKARDQYPPDSPEGKIWCLVDSVFRERVEQATKK